MTNFKYFAYNRKINISPKFNTFLLTRIFSIQESHEE